MQREVRMELTCFVEVPQGSRNKYEFDAERGVIKLDRHLFSSVVFPSDYGFLEETLTEEGNRRLDALVLVSEPTFPGCRIDVRPIGIFQMRDEAGVDDKVLCVPLHDPEWEELHELEDISQRLRDEIAHFFAVYKELEPDRVTAIEGWAGRDVAEQELAAARARFAEQERGRGK
jgi:inorganic pyrophosphatase